MPLPATLVQRSPVLWRAEGSRVLHQAEDDPVRNVRGMCLLWRLLSVTREERIPLDSTRARDLQFSVLHVLVLVRDTPLQRLYTCGTKTKPSGTTRCIPKNIEVHTPCHSQNEKHIRDFSAPIKTKPFFTRVILMRKHTGVHKGRHCLIRISVFVCLSVCLCLSFYMSVCPSVRLSVSLSVNVCMCNIRRFHRLRELYVAVCTNSNLRTRASMG